MMVECTGCPAHNWCKSVIIVDSPALDDSSSNPPGLVAIHRSSSLVLDLKHPPGFDWLVPWRKGNKMVCSIAHNGPVISLNGYLPLVSF